MAILKLDDEQVEVADGSELKDVAEEMGVPFGCGVGACGVCEVEVVAGMENLKEVTEAEENMGIEAPNRLMCQCTIKSGTVEVSI